MLIYGDDNVLKYFTNLLPAVDEDCSCDMQRMVWTGWVWPEPGNWTPLSRCCWSVAEEPFPLCTVRVCLQLIDWSTLPHSLPLISTSALVLSCSSSSLLYLNPSVLSSLHGVFGFIDSKMKILQLFNHPQVCNNIKLRKKMTACFFQLFYFTHLSHRPFCLSLTLRSNKRSKSHLKL